MSEVPPIPARDRWVVVAALIGGYIGVYLCRKNLSVAIPLLIENLHRSKAELGVVASVSTIAYAAGKLLLSPVVDRVGGRRGFLAVLFLVAALGAASAFSPGLATLTVLYSANRFCGAGGWPAMMKLVPTWFPPDRTGRVTAFLSLSYVVGGALAAAFAGLVAERSGGDWRLVMGVPSAVLAVIGLLCAVLVRSGPLAATAAAAAPGRGSVLALFARRQFVIVCLLSATLSLVRETFNTWSVDFLASVQTEGKSVLAAALGSTAFDLGGFASIVAMGFAWDLTRPAARRYLLATILAILTAALLALPHVASAGGTTLLGLVGLLSYGPYSLLAGALAVEAGGAALAATASGVVDAIGYGAGALSGVLLGHILDVGGYALGFECLAGLALLSAGLALGFRAEPARA